MSGADRHRARREARLALWQEDGGCCHYCRIEIVPVEAGTLDHIVPKAFGGTLDRWNLVYSCSDCNGVLRDAVRKCSCRKCERAVDRFHHRRQHARPLERVPRVREVIVRPRGVDEIVSLLEQRGKSAARRLERLPDHDTHEAAALRGKIVAYREAVMLLAGAREDNDQEGVA